MKTDLYTAPGLFGVVGRTKNGYTVLAIPPGMDSPMANHRGGEIAVDTERAFLEGLKMKFTTQQLDNIKLEASNEWEDNERDGSLNDLIINSACAQALSMVLDHEFPDNHDYQGSTPYIDRWYLSNDGKRVDITNILHGRAFTEHDVNAMAKTASEIVTEALEKLLLN